jgi:probable phosphoglycerate mutase
MNQKKIYFVRHGQSEANALKVVADSTPKLTELGREQALETAELLLNEKITTIATSPYIRAIETAKIIAERLGIPEESIIIIDELRERNWGDCANKPKDHESFWYYDADNECNIEPKKEFFARVKIAIEKVKLIKSEGNILAIGHQAIWYYFDKIMTGANDSNEICYANDSEAGDLEHAKVKSFEI